MKKVLAILLALALMIPAMSLAAFAAGSTTIPDAESQVINATYVPAEEVADIYSVNIGWGSLAFTYTEPAQGTWNPDTLQYDGAVAGGWTCDEENGANKITVTNLSNVAINAELTATAADGVAVTFTWDDAVLELESAVGKTEAPKATATLSVAGTITAGGVIGTVTVTLVDPAVVTE